MIMMMMMMRRKEPRREGSFRDDCPGSRKYRQSRMSTSINNKALFCLPLPPLPFQPPIHRLVAPCHHVSSIHQEIDWTFDQTVLLLLPFPFATAHQSPRSTITHPLDAADTVAFRKRILHSLLTLFRPRRRVETNRFPRDIANQGALFPPQTPSVSHATFVHPHLLSSLPSDHNFPTFPTTPWLTWTLTLRAATRSRAL
jgi:hypothetical protein